jgi:hypothetical protein
MKWLSLVNSFRLFRKPEAQRPAPKIHAVPPNGLKKTHGVKGHAFDAFS